MFKELQTFLFGQGQNIIFNAENRNVISKICSVENVTHTIFRFNDDREKSSNFSNDT